MPTDSGEIVFTAKNRDLSVMNKHVDDSETSLSGVIRKLCRRNAAAGSAPNVVVVLGTVLHFLELLWLGALDPSPLYGHDMGLLTTRDGHP